MSVINKMLQDLENRDASNTVNNHYVPLEKTLSRRNAWLIIGLIVIIAILVLALLRMGRSSYAPSTPSAHHSSLQSTVMGAEGPKDEEGGSETRENELRTKEWSEKTLPRHEQDTITKPEPSLHGGGNTPLVSASDSANYPDEPASNSPEVLNASKPSGSAKHQEEKPQTEEAELSEMTVTKSVDDGEVVSLQQRIEQAMKQGETMRSITLLQQLVEQEPDDIAAMKKLASQQFAAGQISQAMRTLEQARRRFDNAPSLLLMLSRLYQHQGKDTLAWETIAEFDGTNTELLSYRATLASSLMRYEAARTDYRQLVQIEPAQARWWLGLGVANDKLSYAHDALVAYRRVLQHGGINSNVEAFVRNRMAVLAEGVQ